MFFVIFALSKTCFSHFPFFEKSIMKIIIFAFFTNSYENKGQMEPFWAQIAKIALFAPKSLFGPKSAFWAQNALLTQKVTFGPKVRF